MVGCLSHPPEFELILLKVGSLDDVKTNHNDTGAARSMALDHLGIIASRLKSTSLKFSPKSLAEGNENRILKPVEEVFIHFLLVLHCAHPLEDLLQSERFRIGRTSFRASRNLLVPV